MSVEYSSVFSDFESAWILTSYSSFHNVYDSKKIHWTKMLPMIIGY